MTAIHECVQAGRELGVMVSVRSGDSDEHLGLGLYVAKLIAEGHGGEIHASNVERGVAFSVTLPDNKYKENKNGE